MCAASVLHDVVGGAEPVEGPNQADDAIHVAHAKLSYSDHNDRTVNQKPQELSKIICCEIRYVRYMIRT